MKRDATQKKHAQIIYDMTDLESDYDSYHQEWRKIYAQGCK